MQAQWTLKGNGGYDSPLQPFYSENNRGIFVPAFEISLLMDLFEKLKADRGPLGKHARLMHGYFTFPKLEGDISPRMVFRGKERLNWSLNNYLGLANHPDIRQVDEEASRNYGLALPMGSRMMSGNSDHHEQLGKEFIRVCR